MVGKMKRVGAELLRFGLLPMVNRFGPDVIYPIFLQKSKSESM